MLFHDNAFEPCKYFSLPLSSFFLIPSSKHHYYLAVLLPTPPQAHYLIIPPATIQLAQIHNVHLYFHDVRLHASILPSSTSFITHLSTITHAL